MFIVGRVVGQSVYLYSLHLLFSWYSFPVLLDWLLKAFGFLFNDNLICPFADHHSLCIFFSTQSHRHQMFLLHKSLLYLTQLFKGGQSCDGSQVQIFAQQKISSSTFLLQYVFIYFQVYRMYLKDVSFVNYSKVRLLNFSVKISPSNLGSASETVFCLSFPSFTFKMTATKAQPHHPLYVECPLILFVCSLS